MLSFRVRLRPGIPGTCCEDVQNLDVGLPASALQGLCSRTPAFLLIGLGSLVLGFRRALDSNQDPRKKFQVRRWKLYCTNRVLRNTGNPVSLQTW